jgi:hypothetical protein
MGVGRTMYGPAPDSYTGIVATDFKGHDFVRGFAVSETSRVENFDVLEADRIRNLRSYAWDDAMVETIPERFIQFAEQSLLPGIKEDRQSWESKKRLLCTQLYYLVETRLSNKTIVDSLSNSSAASRKRKALWRKLKDRGWAQIVLGHRKKGYLTRIYATDELLKQLIGNESVLSHEPVLVRGSELSSQNGIPIVSGHTGKFDPHTGRHLRKEQREKPLVFPGVGDPDRTTVEMCEITLEDINHLNRQHIWQIRHPLGFTLNPSVTLRQIHIGAWGRSCRMYTFGPLSAQGFPKEYRRTMTIDGEPIIELDFHCMHPRMLYHSLGHEVTGDLYDWHKVFPRFASSADGNSEKDTSVRNFLKTSLNICFNTVSRYAATEAIKKHLRTLASFGENWLQQLMAKIEELTVPEFLNRLEQEHSHIRCHFYRNVGMDLMTHEASIMLTTLYEVIASGRPALGIHDGLICRERDADFAYEAMKGSYEARFPGFTPGIQSVPN